MTRGSDGGSVTVAGHPITLSNLDKVLYPAAGTTKRDVINYYYAVSTAMLPHLADRPITRKRWPEGVEEAPFFEKALGARAPSWVTHVTLQHSGRSVDYPVAGSAAVLVWLAQLAALEMHVPQWTMGPRGTPNRPDRLVIDLDPGPGAGLADCAEVATRIRDTLGEYAAGLVPVTSGSKGLHLYLGLNGAMTSQEASEWTRQLAVTVQRAMPDRVVAHMSKADRAGNDITARFSEIGELATTLGEYRAVLDGELVALGDDGVPSFGLLQQRMGLTGAREIERASADVPVHYYVFDLLWLNGIALTGKAVEDRRLLLERLRLESDHCSVPPTLCGSPAAAVDLAREKSWEGIVAKRGGSKYRPGQRSKDWVKVKLLAMQAVVIVGYRPGQGRRADQVGSLLMAIPKSDELCYAGRVGTGFTDAELESLTAQLKPLERKASPVAATVPRADARDAVWVTPRLVGEVTASEMTHDGRLRQPSWRGLRPDLQVDQVTREI